MRARTGNAPRGSNESDIVMNSEKDDRNFRRWKLIWNAISIAFAIAVMASFDNHYISYHTLVWLVVGFLVSMYMTVVVSALRKWKEQD
jgi:cell division protein FtsW (lipid II flippase)